MDDMQGEWQEEPEEQEPWHRGPIKWIIGLFLILIVVLWVVPYYGVRLDPNPARIAKIDEVAGEFEVGNLTKVSDYSEIGRLMVPDDEIIKAAADRIVAIGCKESSVCNAKAIFYFVRDNFNYVADPLAYEYIKSPKESLKARVGDCDDASVLAANLLQAVGIRTRFVLVPRHIFVQAYMPEAPARYRQDGWVSIDPTCRQCGFGEEAIEYSGSERRYLEV